MTRASLPAVLLLLAGCGGSAATTTPAPSSGRPPALDAIREDQLKADLYAMAGDHFRGRESGTLDELKVSMWLADRVREAGLEPAGDDGTYFQYWPMARVRPSTATAIRAGETALTLHQDVVVTSLAPAVVDAPLVDGGETRAVRPGDYAGKAVVLQIAEPKSPLPRDISVRAARYVFLAAGEAVAALASAKPAAIVLVSDATADSAWVFVSNWFRNGSYGLEYGESVMGPRTDIPVLWVRGAAKAAAAPGGRLKANIAFDRFIYPSVNVVAKVPGSDPALRGQYVVFGAHQDHDGIKAPVAGDSISNGADDNASVSVGILAIGRAFVKHPGRRSALFVWHGAEEKGLIGSRYFAAHPTVPRDSLVAIINGDMIGNNHPDSAGLLGVQPPHLNSPELVAMGLEANRMVTGFVIDSTWDRPNHPEGWYFRSDHVPYAAAGIPALYFSSLPHPLYHTPRDEPATINYPKLTKMSRWMYATGWLVAQAPERVKAIRSTPR